MIPRKLQESQSSRAFSKRLTLLVVGVFTAITLLGIYCQIGDLANILTVVGAYLAIFATMYMQIGHSDYRISKGLPGLVDAMVGLLSKKGPPSA